MMGHLSGQVARWLPQDILFRRLVRNVGIVMSGEVGASGLALLSIALTARALGPEALGILVIIEAYNRLIDQWVRPETWQVLIKYGTDALATDDRTEFQRLIKFGFLVDFVGALTAFAIAWTGIQLASGWMNWEPETAEIASIYCLFLIVQLTSTPTALIRLFDRFSMLAYAQILAAATRLVLVAIAWWWEAGLFTFVLIAMFTNVIQPVFMLIAAATELRKRGFTLILRTPLAGVMQRYPRIWTFLISTNLSLLLRKTVENTDVLIVGAVFGPAGSGALHIVKRLAHILIKLGGPVSQVLYPDIAKLWAEKKIRKFQSAVGWTNLAGGGLGLLMLGVVSLDPSLVIRLFAGEEFTAWSNLLLWQILATVIFMFGLGYRPALYSMERDIALLKAVALATMVFYLTFLLGIPLLDVAAASIGHCAFNATWLLATTWFVRRAMREGEAAAKSA